MKKLVEKAWLHQAGGYRKEVVANGDGSARFRFCQNLVADEVVILIRGPKRSRVRAVRMIWIGMRGKIRAGQTFYALSENLAKLPQTGFYVGVGRGRYAPTVPGTPGHTPVSVGALKPGWR